MTVLPHPQTGREERLRATAAGRKQTGGSKPKIIALPGDLSACGYYRVFAPLAAMERAGLAEVHRPEPTIDEDGHVDVRINTEDLKGFDIAVFQRQPEMRILALFGHARRYGTKTVYDVDDDLFNVPPNSPAYLAYGRDWCRVGGLGKLVGRTYQEFPPVSDGRIILDPKRREYAALEHAAHEWTDQARANCAGIIRNMRAADLVTVSTERLREVYGAHRSDLVILRNQIEPRDWAGAIEDPYPKPEQECWIGWAGTRTHYADLKEIARAVVTVLQRNPNTRLVLAGFPEARSLFQKVTAQVVTFDWMPITDYRRIVAAFDIALAPLDAIKFNEAKSDIRVLEAALCGVPVVASETTYGDTVRAGNCGLVAKTPQKWIGHLERLVHNPDLRKQMGENGRKYVTRKRTYDANAWRWAEAYAQLMN